MPDGGACAGQADDQINQLCFRCGFEQGCQRIVLPAFFRHGSLHWKLKLHELTQQRQSLYPMLPTQAFIGNRLHRR